MIIISLIKVDNNSDNNNNNNLKESIFFTRLLALRYIKLRTEVFRSRTRISRKTYFNTMYLRKTSGVATKIFLLGRRGRRGYIFRFSQTQVSTFWF